MNVNQQFIFYLLLSLSILFAISFSYGTLIKKYTSLNLLFYFPLGFLVFLGLSYFLSFPFVFFKWSSKIYFVILALISLIAFFYSSVIFFRERLYKNITSVKFVFSLLGIIFILFAFYQTTKYSVAPNAFDTVYYNSFVISNITKPYLGWWYAMDNLPLNYVQVQYDFSSYYYIHSLTSIILRTIFSNMNELFYAPLFMWQATISLATLIFFTTVNCFKAFFEKKNYFWFLTIFSIICLFYGSMYFNTALGFIGNSYRAYIVACIFLGIQALFKKETRKTPLIILLMIMNAALISVSSSGFFISAFIMYGLFYAYFKKYGFITFRDVGTISIPTFLFLFAFVFGKITLILTPLIYLLFYYLPKLKIIQDKNFNKYFYNFMPHTIPCIIIASTILFKTFYEYDYSYFFYQGSSRDMVWDYFAFNTLPSAVVNILLIALISIILTHKNKEENGVSSITKIIFLTFLNPLVIPFTVKFLTDFVFYRAFDIFFNPFIISFALSLASGYVIKKSEKAKSLLALSLAIPFLLFGLFNYTQYYHFFFEQPENYNFLLKQTNNEFDVLSRLNEIIKNNQETRPIVASQIIQTIGFVQNTNMPYSQTNVLTIESKYLSQDQADLLNIMIYSSVTSFTGTVDGKEPEFERAAELMIKCNVKYAIINKNSFYYHEETDSYIYLFSVLYQEFDVLYTNEEYVIFEITH